MVSDAGISRLEAYLIDIYPNPVNDILSIKSEKAMKAAKIYTLSGKLVQDIPTNGENELIMEFNTKTGVYYIQLEDTNGVSVRKRIIKINQQLITKKRASST